MNNAFKSLDFPPEAAGCAFPSETFLPGGDLTPIEQSIAGIIDGLTLWQPAKAPKSGPESTKIEITGDNYEEALTAMNRLFLRNSWGDGLPLLPPTGERVNRILEGTGLQHHTLVGGGKILPRGGKATVEMLAVSLAMAGGRPEYLPFLIAAIEAITSPPFAHEATNATTGACSPLVIVNGPAAKEIRLNSGYSCLGPSPEFPSGASIGRAIRFILMNLGGGLPGTGSMSLYGGPGRYTGLVFAENEESLPPDWEPLNTEYGFPAGSNTATVHVVDLYGEVWEGAAVSDENIVDNLQSWAEAMANPVHPPNWIQFRNGSAGTPGYLLIGPLAARQLSKSGWSKQKVKQYLWEQARVPASRRLRRILEERITVGDFTENEARYPMPIARSPENIKVVVAGGESSQHSYWLRVGQRGASVTSAIRLPGSWGHLIDKSVEELGPFPENR